MENDKRKILLGLIFVAVGALFLLQNFGLFYFEIPDFLWRWEMILIIIGVINIFTKKYPTAFILIGIGTFFWLVDDFNVDVWDLWPVVLIIIGLSFIMKQGVFSSEKKNLR